MMRFILLFPVFSFSFAIVFSQETCKLRGSIVDSLALPVYDASVTAFNNKDEGAGFTYTDINGEFTLELPCNQEYEVEVEHVSYESFLKKESLTKNKRVQYILKNSSIELKEAVVEARVPIKIKGDTIEYDAESFRTEADESLEDILKKLPGIEVENGKVYHEGKEITSITVEGREIFGGNTKLLNKNLPSEVVDKIQLNKKFKNNPFTNSLQDDEQPALNITLKEDKKSLIFGNITMGGDADTHYDLQEKLFYFSPKTDGTVITDYNTFGKEVFTNEDYFSFLGGISEFTEEGSKFSLRNSVSSIFFGNDNNANELSDLINAFHFGYEPNDKWYMNGFTLFNRNEIKNNITTENIYDFGSVIDQSETEQSILTGLARLRVDFNPTDNGQFKYRANFNYTDNEQDDDIVTTNPTVTDPIFRRTNNQLENFSLRQKLTYLKKIGNDDNIGIYLRHQYQNETPDWLLNATSDPFLILGLTPQNDTYNLDQQQQLRNSTFQIYSIYNHLITNTSNLKIKLGGNFSSQQFENEIFSFGDNLSASDSDLLTDSDFNYSEYYADLTYTKKFWKITLDAGAGLHNFNIKNEGPTYSTDFDLTRVLPHANLELEVNSSERWNLSYEQTYELPQVKELSTATRIQSINALFNGNQDLERSLRHSYNLNYGVFNGFKFFHFYFNLNYQRLIDNFQNNSIQRIASNAVNVTQLNRTVNNFDPQENWNGSFSISKRFSSKYQIRFNGSVNFSDFKSIVSRDLSQVGGTLELDTVQNNILSHNYTLRNTFKFKKKIETNFGIRANFNDNQALVNTTFSNWQPFIDLAYSINKKLLFQADYAYQVQFTNGDYVNHNNDLNASLRYKVMKKTYLKLTAGNILGNNQLVSTSFDNANNITTINTTDILGRYFIFSVRVKF